MQKKLFGTIKERDIYSYTIKNTSGMSAEVIEYGGIVRSLKVPDKDGNLNDVLIGYDTLDEYHKDDCYLNCLVGRYANRIGQGRLVLSGKEYALFCNDGENHLHGGRLGFNKKVWNVTPLETSDGQALKLEYTSPDGEEGFPGNLTVTVTYTINEACEFGIEYEAKTDKETVVCLTWHGYLNLASSSTIKGHVLSLNASRFTTVAANYVPTGDIESVEGTYLDLREPVRLENVLESNDSLLLEGGFDHNFVLDKPLGEYGLAATVFDPESGRKLAMCTTEPAVQLYSGNFLDGRAGKHGAMNKFGGLCLEAQHYPDSPNKPDFPTTILLPGQQYYQKTVYKFSVTT